MLNFRLVVPMVVFVAGLLATTTLSFGKAEYTKKEKKACIFCHAKAAPKDGKDLNAVGKCYGEKKSLTGCVEKK